jgi:hypothetical protein
MFIMRVLKLRSFILFKQAIANYTPKCITFKKRKSIVRWFVK